MAVGRAILPTRCRRPLHSPSVAIPLQDRVAAQAADAAAIWTRRRRLRFRAPERTHIVRAILERPMEAARVSGPRWEAFFWILGLALLLIGIASRQKPVLATIHARADPSTVYWTGRLAQPAIQSGVYFQSILVNHYRTPPHPFPEQVPFRVSLRMPLVIRDEGVHHFELDSSWFGALEVDGERVFGSGPFSPGHSAVGDIDLGSGVHQVELLLQPRLLQPRKEDPEGAIRLLWRTPTETLRPLTATDLTRQESPRIFAFGVVAASPLIWVGGFVLIYLTLRGALAEGTPPSARRLLVTAMVLAVLALVTRSVNFAEYPFLGSDELHNAWAGFNLLHEGKPKS